MVFTYLQVAKYCSGSLRKRQVSFSQRKYRHSESRVHSLCVKPLINHYIRFDVYLIFTLINRRKGKRKLTTKKA